MKLTLPALIYFFVKGEELQLDGFLIEIRGKAESILSNNYFTGKQYSETSQLFGETVRRVLTYFSDQDPAGDAVIHSQYIDRRGWRYKFNDEDIFVTTFAPCYSNSHFRYLFGAGKHVEAAYVLLQPEWSFGIHNVPTFGSLDFTLLYFSDWRRSPMG